MSQKPLAIVRMKTAEHKAFGKVSGDVNPIHFDAAYSRRAFAGEVVVHGVHLVLYALDAHFKGARGSAGPLTVSARFMKPGYPGESIEVTRTADPREEGVSRLVVTAAGATLAEVVVTARESGDMPTPPDGTLLKSTPPVKPGAKPAELAMDEIDGLSGAIAAADAKAAGRLFPHAAKALGADVVGGIARLSGIVGMECPGRDSLLSQITVDLQPGARTSAIHWRVAKADRLLRLVRLAVRADGLNGTVQAFVRRPPPPAPDMAAIARQVAPGEFAGQRALIVGGSRGLGAATAAIIAAGGGLAAMTYHESGQDAAALQRAIVEAGFTAETLKFDATLKSDAIAKLARKFGITHLYYFATPKIFARRREPFDNALFRRFCEVYVDGFAHLCAAVASAMPSVAVFYPSSTAIGEFVPDLTEYSAAKAAGETLCDVLPRTLPQLTIMRMRLPRITTDQTASLIAAAASDPVDVMLPIVRELHRSSAAMFEAERT